MTSFHQIESSAIIDSIAGQLTAKILAGELKPGNKLPTERVLAELFGSSRSSVHQAVLTLERQGFLSIVPRRGIVVCDFRNHPTTQSLEALMNYSSVDLDVSLFKDMMDTRLWLESECARRACTHIYDRTLAEMQKLVEQMEQPDADLTGLIYRFHYTLTQASGNSLYAMIFRGFEPVIRSLIQRHYTLKALDLQESVALRYQLLDAIRQKDEDAAAELVCRIINQGISVLRQRYQ